MDIRVSGHQVETGEALKTHVTDRLQGIADKYFSRAISAQTTFGKGPHDNGFTCDIVAHVRQGLVLKASNKGMEAHGAFEGAAERIETQLRRYTRRLKDHHAGPNGVNGGQDDGADAIGPQRGEGGAHEEGPDHRRVGDRDGQTLSDLRHGEPPG